MGFQLFMQVLHVIDGEMELKENSIMEKNTHACPFKGCEAAFSRPYRLEDHINTHTGELPFKCKIPGCKKEYHSRNSLNKHIKLFHESNASSYTTFLRCPYPSCMMVLQNRMTLHKHYQRQHTGQFKFVCQYCDKGFHKHTQLQSHVYHHTGIPPLRCATCNTGFVYQRDLNRHLRGHRKWECDVDDCGKVFDDWNVLRKHLGTDHSGEFVCDECQKTFKTKYALRMHVLCHLEVANRSVFECPYENCKRYYLQKQNLNHHIQFKHKGKVYECKECGKTLCTKAKLTKHIKVFHEQQQQPVQAKKHTTPRKLRKDAGIPHQSMAAKLSGATIPYKEEKLLLENEYKSTLEDDPLAETNLTTYSTCQAAKPRTVAKQKLSKNPWCIGHSSASTTVNKNGSQKLKVSEVTAEGSVRKQKHSSEPSVLKCDIDGLHTEVRDRNLYSNRLDTNNEGIKQKYMDYDVKYASVSASPGNEQNKIKPGSDIGQALGEEQKISDTENCSKISECNVDTSVLEQTHCMLYSKNSCTQENESCGSDKLCKIQKKAFDSDVNMDALHGQGPKKVLCQVYDLKKWILIMTGMMELVCPKVSSESC